MQAVLPRLGAASGMRSPSRTSGMCLTAHGWLVGLRCPDGENGSSFVCPTVLECSGEPTSKLELKAVSRHRGSQDRALTTENEVAHRVRSGNPAFRRPSICSFEFDCPPRAIHPDIVKAGSVSST
jgi:hypothetical protein